MRLWFAPRPWSLAIGGLLCIALASTCTVAGPTKTPVATPPVADVAPEAVPRAAGAPAVAPAPEPAPAPAPVGAEPPWDSEDLPRIKAVAPLVERAAARYDLDPGMLDAIIWHESRFQAQARGPGGAAGLMQLMPSTSKGLAKRMGVANRPFDPRFNVEAGALLMSRLLTIFDGDVELALAGYALGHVAVKRRLAEGESLPERTQRFITKVTAWTPAFATLHAHTKPPA
jgi:soluble lytic murein transglycosylase-like protein